MRNKANKKRGNFLVIASDSMLRLREDSNQPIRRFALYYHWFNVFECDTKKEFVEYATVNGYDISELKFDWASRYICDYKIKNYTELCGLKDQIQLAYFRGIVKRNKKKERK